MPVVSEEEMPGNGPLPGISRKHIKNAPVGRRAPVGRQRVQHSMYSRPARREESVKEVLKREYPRGVDLVYESVGGDMFEVRLAVEVVWGREGLFAVLWCGGWTAGSGRVGAAAIMSNRREGSVCWVPGRSMPATPLLTLAAARASAVALLPQTCLNALAVGGRLVVIGAMSQYQSGWQPSVHRGVNEKLLMKSASVTGG